MAVLLIRAVVCIVARLIIAVVYRLLLLYPISFLIVLLPGYVLIF